MLKTTKLQQRRVPTSTVVVASENAQQQLGPAILRTRLGLLSENYGHKATVWNFLELLLFNLLINLLVATALFWEWYACKYHKTIHHHGNCCIDR